MRRKIVLAGLLLSCICVLAGCQNTKESESQTETTAASDPVVAPQDTDAWASSVQLFVEDAKLSETDAEDLMQFLYDTVSCYGVTSVQKSGTPADDGCELWTIHSTDGIGYTMHVKNHTVVQIINDLGIVKYTAENA